MRLRCARASLRSSGLISVRARFRGGPARSVEVVAAPVDEAAGSETGVRSGDGASPSLFGDGRERIEGLTKAEFGGDMCMFRRGCTWKGEADLGGNKEERTEETSGLQTASSTYVVVRMKQTATYQKPRRHFPAQTSPHTIGGAQLRIPLNSLCAHSFINPIANTFIRGRITSLISGVCAAENAISLDKNNSLLVTQMPIFSEFSSPARNLVASILAPHQGPPQSNLQHTSAHQYAFSPIVRYSAMPTYAVGEGEYLQNHQVDAETRTQGTIGRSVRFV